MKRCFECKETMPLEMFTRAKAAKDGLQSYCKICRIKKNAEYLITPQGRAKRLIGGMHNSKKGKRANMEKTITADDIIPFLEVGYCQLTNLPFDFKPIDKTSKNPYAPSIDRINSQKGYTKENCRIVLSAVNDALGENDDNDMLPILKALVKGLEKNATENTAAPIPTRPDTKSNDNPQLRIIPTTGAGQDGDDIDHHSGTVQRQDVNHRTQASSSDGMGHGNKQVATSQQLNLL